MNDSKSKTKKPLINEKTITTQEEIWDRTPILSRMNSLECWDYTIELECLNGPQGSATFFFYILTLF